MPYLPLITALFLCFATALQASEPLVIRSAVATDFPNGLHSKYIGFIADAMDMPVQIAPMSFSRRLRALQAGELDILAGLQNKEPLEDIIYIQPAYQVLASTFFVRSADISKLNQYRDLQSKRIAVTADVSYFSQFDQDKQLAKVVVDSLQQKIKLLVNNRVDTFVHNKDSTQVSLKLMGMTGQVVPARYQPSDKRKYYFAISRQSKLYPHLTKLKAVIKQAVAEGKFVEIRKQHYLELAKAARASGEFSAAFE